ncbi:MAG TPA: tryptophan synthase subunit alpha, partial [Thermoanaerobaculia bacterium]
DAARLSSGFLYVVSRPGTTGARDRLPDDLPRTVRRARKAARELPVAIGFGISTPAAARAAARLADGVVVGSALVRAAETGKDARDAERGVERLARDLVTACRRGKSS